jgi:hypothetical protein
MLDSAPRVCGGATPNCSAGYMIRG